MLFFDHTMGWGGKHTFYLKPFIILTVIIGSYVSIYLPILSMQIILTSSLSIYS